jgi:DNA-binding transcriptional MerR regulator
MFSIGEFSKLTRVTVKMLRHYDEIALLKPAATDARSGYRYYTVDQLPRLEIRRRVIVSPGCEEGGLPARVRGRALCEAS